MFNLDDITNKNYEKHNKKWPCISYNKCRLLIIEGSGSGKTNAFLSLTKKQDDIGYNLFASQRFK